jgi:hypothetical protein
MLGYENQQVNEETAGVVVACVGGTCSGGSEGV